MLKIFPLLAFKDNYIWVLHNSENQTIGVVDPGTEVPVLDLLEKQKLRLSCILVTHHHWDHTGGVENLLKLFNVPVYSSNYGESLSSRYAVQENSKITLPDLNVSFTVLEIPGHTNDHIAYYNEKVLFSGDTLFTGGCGKLFEGTAETMYHSLTKLNKLPGDTLVYCGHEYTLNNLLFAEDVEPNNEKIHARLDDVKKMRNANCPTVPSTLLIEKETNPFLRCHLASVKDAAIRYAKKELNSPSEVFAEIRKWKDAK